MTPSDVPPCCELCHLYQPTVQILRFKLLAEPPSAAPTEATPSTARGLKALAADRHFQACTFETCYMAAASRIITLAAD